MVYGAAVNAQTIASLNDVCVAPDGRQINYCPYCGKGTDFAVHFCLTCLRAIPQATGHQSRRLEHGFSVPHLACDRSLMPVFWRSKREYESERSRQQLCKLLVGLAGATTIALSTAWVFMGKSLF